ncbi:MAG TPA: hypothetical protein VMZ92_02805 [Planctomycetota bacterium]|nr:hypothetical protein [Planctomycetota bacterium]
MARIQDVNGDPVLEDISGSGTPGALNDEVLLDLHGQAVVAVQVANIGDMTIAFEGSVDGVAYSVLRGIKASDASIASAVTVDGVWILASGGFNKVRARVSVYTSGTADVSMKAGQGDLADASGAAGSAGGLTDAELRAAPVPVSAAALPLPAGASTAALQLPDGHNVTVDNAAGGAAVNVQDGGNSLTVDGSVAVDGQTANDAAVTGNPVRIGAKADTTEPTAVGDGDAVDLLADLNGKLVTQPYSVPERSTSGITANIVATGDISVIAAPGAGLRLYITNILVTNGHDTVGTWVNIKDGATTIFTGYARWRGGGFSVPLPKPLRLTANTALNAANETTASETRVSAAGFIAP